MAKGKNKSEFDDFLHIAYNCMVEVAKVVIPFARISFKYLTLSKEEQMQLSKEDKDGIATFWFMVFLTLITIFIIGLVLVRVVN